MSNKINKAYLLSDIKKTALTVSSAKGKASVKVPMIAPDTLNTVVVLQFTGEPMIAPSPVKGKQITVSSQKNETTGGKNLLDGDRLTRWEAAKGEHKASLDISLLKPVLISTLIIDEPWHPWESKKQTVNLQYKNGDNWITILTATTGGIGYTTTFKPVMAQEFRLLIENKDAEPTLLEWQLYGPE